MEFTNNLKLPLLVPNQSGKEFTHNEALIILDNLLHNGVKGVVNEPPPEPSIGDRYLVGLEPTGGFLDRENSIAFYDNGWRFIAPFSGQLIWNIALSKLYVFNENWSEAVVNTSNGEEGVFSLNFSFNNPQVGDLLVYDNGKFANKSDTLSNLVDKDLSNLSTTAKKLVCKLASPSNRCVELTAGASSSNYVAVANGWVNILLKASSDNAVGKLQNNTAQYMSIQYVIPKANQYVAVVIPCSAGDVIQYTYSYQTVITLTFHYSNGN
ncbi:MAG: DUF2793 domain-containing protein [Rickettsiales bacterium]|jgi:hypothetical protein|nr:DUF2793 domain-containing protein [Rickettsiales bacterium]